MINDVLPGEDKLSQQQAASHQQSDMLLVRASFIGDCFLDPCFLFMPVPDKHAATFRTKHPQQIPITLPVSPVAEGHRERQATGQMAQAAGPVRPTVRMQAAEPVLGSDNPAERQLPSSSRQAKQATGHGALKVAGGQVKKHGRKAANPIDGQYHKAAPPSERQLPVGRVQQRGPLQPALPDHEPSQEPACMLRNLDIRQNITSRTELQ